MSLRTPEDSDSVEVARRVEPSSPLKKLGQKKPGPAGESKITLFSGWWFGT